MAKSGAYRLLVVESFRLERTRDPVHIRPISGQIYPPSMRLECSSRMINTSIYRVGTKFKVWVRQKQKANSKSHLYCYYGDEIVVVSDSEAQKLIVEMKKGGA